MSQLADWVNQLNTPGSLGGTAATPQQLSLPSANYGGNLIRNGSFESWASGTTSAPDGWTLTGASASVARNTTNVQRGLSSVDVTNGANNAADLAESVTLSSTQNTHLRGRIVTLSCMVKTSTASRAFIKLDDAVATASSIYHTGSGNFEFMSVSLEVALTATKIEASIEIASGSAITVTADGAMLVEGNTPVGFSSNFADIVLVPRNVTSQSSTSRGNVAYADLDAMSIANVIVDGAQSVEVSCTIAAANDAADSKSGFQVVRGSTRVPYDFAFGHTFAAADDTNGSKTEVVTINIIDIKPAAGNYTYKIQWAAISGGTVYAFQRSMSVRILPEGVSA